MFIAVVMIKNMNCPNLKKYKGPVIIMLLTVFFVLPGLVFNINAASGVDKAVDGLEASGKEAFGADSQSLTTTVPTAIGKIVGAGLAFIGVLFFGLVIYGGLLWMTARGNEQQVEKAKDLIVAAIIGLVIVLAAYAITSYIGGSLTGTA